MIILKDWKVASHEEGMFRGIDVVFENSVDYFVINMSKEGATSFPIGSKVIMTLEVRK